MANEFKVRKGLIVYGSGSSPVLDVQGSQGQLFSITDSLSGSLWSVNDISGIPVMEAFSDNTIKIGTFGNEAIIVSGSSTGMGTATPTAKLHISGSSGSALFEIDSPQQNNILFVSGSGNVGIGSSTPFQRLYVAGDIGLQGASFLNLAGDQGSSRTTGFQFSGATYDKIFVYTNNTVVGNISRDYGWGIGFSTQPSARLHVSGSSNSGLFRIDSPVLNNIIFVSGSGNVGIGTNLPTKRFEIFDGTAGDGLSIVRSTVTSQRIELIPNDGTATALIKGGGNNKPFYIASWANGGTAQPLYFGTNYTTGTNEVRMTISTTGNVGINNLSPQYRLDVSGSGNFTNNLIVTGSLTVSGSSTLTNIGPAIFSGSLAVTAGITGSLLGTASYSTIAETVTNQDYAIVYAIVL